MSVPVDIDAFAEALATYGHDAFVVTSGDERPHLTQQTMTLDGTTLRCSAGKTASANAEARPAVALLWPPVDEGGYSLIADGVATVERTDDGARLAIELTRAVQHRPAAGGGNDCAPVS